MTIDASDTSSSFGDTGGGLLLYPGQNTSYDSSDSSFDTTRPLFNPDSNNSEEYDEGLTPSELFDSCREPSQICIPLPRRSNTSDHSVLNDSQVDMSIASTIISGGPSTSLTANSSSLPSFSPPSNNVSISSVGTQSESMSLTHASIQAPDTSSALPSQLNNIPSRGKSGKKGNSFSPSKHHGSDVVTSRKSSASSGSGSDRAGNRSPRPPSFHGSEALASSSFMRDDRETAVKLAKLEVELNMMTQLLEVAKKNEAAAEARLAEMRAEAKQAVEKAEAREAKAEARETKAEVREVKVKAEAEAREEKVRAKAKEAIEKAEAREAAARAESKEEVEKAYARADNIIKLFTDALQSKRV